MGKRLIIKGADFSANSVDVGITEFLGSKFYPQEALGSTWGTKQSNNTRCCVLVADLSQYIEIYNRVRMRLKPGYDYVFAFGTAISAGKYYKGDSEETVFAWVTDYEYVVAPLSNTYPFLCINLRHSDNTTTFVANTDLSDIVQEIVVYNE